MAGFYLFSRQFLEDLPKRLKGPGRFRFIFQPAVAIFFGIRAGISDARAGRKPYILGVLFDNQRRRALLKEAFEPALGADCNVDSAGCAIAVSDLA